MRMLKRHICCASLDGRKGLDKNKDIFEEEQECKGRGPV